MEFPGNATPVIPSAMAAAVVPAYAQRFGRPPDRETAELLLALLFLENDHGRAVIEHNWGNISAFAGPSVDYYRPPWFDLEKVEAMPDNVAGGGFGAEVTNDKKARYLRLHTQMLAGTVPSAFRAFRDDQSGIVSWLANVKPSMYDAAATGDPKQFAFAYWRSGYCPDEACKNSAPTYAALQAEIRRAGYFAKLEPSKKKADPSPAVPASPSGGLAMAGVLRSSLSQASQSSDTSFTGLFDSAGPVSPMTRTAVVLCAQRELELVIAGYFTSSCVDGYWADVMHQSELAPHPKEWCGALALHSLHAAGVGNELTWRFQTATDKRSGFLWALTRTEDPKPGDIGYIDQPFQHHFIVERVEGALLDCIDGNQTAEEPIKRVERKLGARGVVYFSIASLLPVGEA